MFNAANEPYDYLVVVDDLPAALQPNCPKENLLHVATEPPIARHYDEKFLSQFAWTIRQGNEKKSQGAIFYQGGWNWHIGWKQGDSEDKGLSFYEIKSLFDTPKTKLISVISSNLTISTHHQKRLEFAQRLKEHYGSKIDLFGRGIVSMEDKIVALKDYRFHVVLENMPYDHYFSEKFLDCVLAGAYPIYHGCPNLDEYFPAHSYVRIDIHDFDQCVAVIDQALEQEMDKKFRAELLAARDRVLYEHNLFPMLIKLIAKLAQGEFGKPNVPVLHGGAILPIGHEKFRPLLEPLPNLMQRLNLIKRLKLFCSEGTIYFSKSKKYKQH